MDLGDLDRVRAEEWGRGAGCLGQGESRGVGCRLDLGDLDRVRAEEWGAGWT